MPQTAARPAPFVPPSRTRLLLTYLRGPLAVFAEAVRDSALPVYSVGVERPGNPQGKAQFRTELITHPAASYEQLRDSIHAATFRGRPIHLQRIRHQIVIWQGPTGML